MIAFAVAAMLLAAASARSAEAAGLPKILTQSSTHPFQVRPAVISYTGDGTGIVGGPDGTDTRHLGRLRWPVYTRRQAYGSGLVWLNDCEPSCAEGDFSGVPVRLHAFAPRGGRFRRLTLSYTYEGQHYTDRRIIRHFGGAGGYWNYAIVSRG